MDMMTVVLDGFGGDNAPLEIVRGAIDSVNEFEDLQVVVTGREEELKNILTQEGYEGDRIKIVNADEVITNDEQPTIAIRRKKNSSLVVGLDYVNEHPEENIAGFVSAGSTGAVLTGALLKIGRAEGIKRPTLAPPMPNLAGGKTLICDSGANVDSKPEFLCGFALMGSIYMQKMFGVENPRVGLLNVGTEDEKGNAFSHEAFALLKEMTSINFIGNIEARDISSGTVDVVVTDGFAGNVALKSAEGTALFILKSLKKNIKKGGLRAKVGYLLMKKVVKNLVNDVDFNKVGGSPFLGCKKVVVKSHGSSDRIAIRGSIALCRKVYIEKFTQTLQEEIAKHPLVSKDE